MIVHLYARHTSLRSREVEGGGDRGRALNGGKGLRDGLQNFIDARSPPV